MVTALVGISTLFATAPRAPAQTVWGHALSFDGVNDAISASGITLTNASMTIELWAQTASPAKWWNPFVSQGWGSLSNGLYFSYVGNAVGFGYYGGELFTQPIFTDTNWHHWAATHNQDTGERCIYRNGQIVATDTNWGSYTGSGEFWIGEMPFSAPDFFDGQLDEVRVWNVARTAAEIRQHLHGRLTGQEPNLIAYWKFDEGSGTTTHDSSTNGYDGNLNGPQWTVSTVPESLWGSALSFDGVDDYVRATIPPLANNYTVSAWVYLRAGGNVAGGGANVVGVLSASCGTSAEVLIRSQTSSSADPQYLELGRCNSFIGTVSTREVPLHQWTHIAVSVSATKQVAYFINGIAAGSWNASAHDLTIGPNIKLGDNSFRRFNGMLEDVRVWNKARTEAEIEADLAHPLTGWESNLVAYWVFDEGAGATALDRTTNEHNGTLVNGALWIASTAPWGTPPVAEITSPQAPAWADAGKPMEFVVTGIDPDNNLSYCDMAVDGFVVGHQSFSSSNSHATCTFTYTFTKPGTNDVWFQAFDVQNNPSIGAHRTVQVIGPPISKNLRVLTFNTHLFENSPVECVARCGGIWPDYNYEDADRRWWIAAHVRSSGADIVALQEVWSFMYRVWFADTLDEGSPLYRYYSYDVENTVNCKEGFRAYNSALPACVDAQSLLFLPEGDWERRFNTLGPGLLLLSKYPFSGLRFQRFPTYYQNARPGDSEVWSDKGVLTATVDLAGTPIRIGISHALTGAYDDWHFGSWDYDYLNKPITAFQARGESYLFALRNDGQARISRLEDYSCFDEAAQATKHGAGWKHIYTNYMGNYDRLTSFQSGGSSYLLAQAGFDAHIYRINDDPSTGWTVAPTNIPILFNAVIPFRLANHPYLLGVAGDSTAAILRINDDPSTGWTTLYTNAWDSASQCVLAFESGGEPYFFSVFGPAYGQARITKVNSDPATGWTHLYTNSWDAVWNPNNAQTRSFQLNGKAYLLGYNFQGQARFTRLDTGPSTGWTHLSTNEGWGKGYVAVTPFEMKGHPCFFMQLACCGQSLDSTRARPQPWRASLRRINDDGQGWEELLQLEGIRMIRDATVVDRDGTPAIMMGDFNVHPDNYGVMDEIFKKVGAVDAYTKVHGSAAGGETIDWFQNPLMQYFWPTTNFNDPTLVSRIDYVYIKPAGNGLWLEPTDAYVRRDWTHVAGKDLSDHYPLLVEFRLQEEVRLGATPVPGGQWQLLITGTIGRLCEVQYSSDLVTWDELAEVRITGSPHLFTDPTLVPTGARFYRLRLLP